MKMKLGQRVVIGYYKTKLRALGLASPRMAAEQAFKIFCTPYSNGVKQKEPLIFHKAIKHSVQFEGLNIRGFQWKPEHYNDRKVLIVHGFSSYSYKFEQYIQPLLKEGFEVLAFDAPAHGLSEGYMINALIYMRFLKKIDMEFGDIHGFIAHSLGGLATSLLAESFPSTENRKFALIAPATETRSAVRGFYQLFKINPAVQTEFEQLIQSMTGKQMDHFSIKRVVEQINPPILWIHDKEDHICPYADTIPVQSMQHPHIQFHITNGLGHNKIYHDKGVIQLIINFLTQS